MNAGRLCRPWSFAGVVLAAISVAGASEWSVESPDGHVQARILRGADGMGCSVTWNGREVLAPSRIGLSTDGKNWGVAVVGYPVRRQIKEDYPVNGGHARAHRDANELSLPLALSSGDKGVLEVQVQNDGLAWRYRLPESAARKVGQEVSEWRLPQGSKIWFQSDLGSYEGIFGGTSLEQLAAESKKPIVALPATAELPGGGYALLSEAAVVDFADSATRVTTDGALELFMHAQPQGWTTNDPVVQPWRVLVLASDLNALVNTDFFTNLCPAPSTELSGASWIKPGRSVWQWWSSGGPKFSEQSQWLDWTRRTGFEYYLVDEGWKNWRHGDDDAWTCLSKVCAEAKEKGVGIWIWMHSRDVPDRASLAAFCQKAAKLGVVGVKIDFIPGAGRDWSNWYVQALREAAASHLMVDFHGATKPSGLERTWPNEMSRESVRGHEYHISRYHRVLPPEHDTILPFTRFVIGHGDYTPTVFEPKELKGHTWARELAQAIVFTSPFLCYADHPKNYLQNPAFDVMKAIPPVWDETVVLPGSEIGKCAALARRSDDRWFVGVINGAEATDVDIPLSFLGKGDYHAMVLTDDESRADGWTRRDQTFAASDHLKLNVQSSGGACAFFEPVGTPKR